MSQEQKIDLLNELMAGDGVDQNNATLFTVQDIRTWMNLKTVKEGKTKCPACRSHLQTYRRTISNSQVYWMAILDKYSLHGQRWVDHKKVATRLYEALQRNASDAPLLIHWGLIEVNEAVPGQYKITQLGMDFINGRTRVPKYLTFTNNKVWKRSVETIHVLDCRNFNLNEIRLFNPELTYMPVTINS